MFHTYVLAAHGKSVDIGRAQFLMDKELAKQAAEWVDGNHAFLLHGRNWMGGNQSALTENDKNQAFWDYYCERHREKYGKPFEPNVSPDWS